MWRHPLLRLRLGMYAEERTGGKGVGRQRAGHIYLGPLVEKFSPEFSCQKDLPSWLFQSREIANDVAYLNPSVKCLTMWN
jgi:hypothetical protein